jgi:hypothetical protein
MARRKRGKKRRLPHHLPVCKICESIIAPRQGTDEHVYPVWLRARIEQWYAALPPEFDAPWKHVRATILKPVCQPCHRRINRLFETYAAKELLLRIIDGDALELAPDQLTILAGWFAKTAFSLGLAPRPNKNTLPIKGIRLIRRELQGLLESGVPPEHASIRLAYVTTSIEQSSQPVAVPGWRDLFQGEPGTISLVALPTMACELLTLSGPGLVKHIEATKNDDRFIRLWPRQSESVIWPPSGHLSLGGVGLLYREWGQGPEALSGNFPLLTLRNPDAPDEQHQSSP